jgi:cell division septation protein DedD
MSRIVAAAACVLLPVFSAAAQQDAASQGSARVLAKARQLGNAGQISAARRLTDSLAKSMTEDAADLAEVLFARATFAPSMLDASLDYEKIVSELAPSATARASLLRLAQRALISADATKALDYLQRILRNYPDDVSVAEAQYWRARALLEAHELTTACAANREARAHAGGSDARMAVAIESQRLMSCGDTPLVDQAVTPKVLTAGAITPKDATPTNILPTAITSSRKAYAVQVAAFATRRDAEAMADRLKRAGLDTHVDGSVKPFRVRIGRYATYADAAKALRDLKARKIAGFVSETNE